MGYDNKNKVLLGTIFLPCKYVSMLIAWIFPQVQTLFESSKHSFILVKVPAQDYSRLFFCLFFLDQDSLQVRLNDHTTTTRHGVTRRSKKRLKHNGYLFRKNLQLKGIY